MARPIIAGLTGGIATGKTTAAAHMITRGIPVFDADGVVHLLYGPGGAAVAPITRRFGEVCHPEGGIDREKLAAKLAVEPAGFADLEAIVHPLVRQAERDFLMQAGERGVPLVVLDIPLLYETGAETRCDTVIVVACAPDTQRRRAMARPHMTAEKLDMILARQLPIGEKAKRADHVINSELPLEEMYQSIDALMDRLVSAGSENTKD